MRICSTITRKKLEMQSKMKTKKTQKQAVAFVLATALAFMAARVLLSLFRGRRKGCPEIKIRINLTTSEILNLADCIVAKSKKIHDSVAAVPLDKVAYSNVIKPLAELEAEQSYLVQSCLLPRMVATSKDVREASVEAEKIIDAHNVNCSMREDVYLVVKAFAARGEWLDSEAQRYVNRLVREFERQGVHLTSGKREEFERVKTRIGELCNKFVNNLNEEGRYLLFKESDLAGLPSDFIKGLDKTEDGKLRVNDKPTHTYPILKHCKVGATRKAVAVAKDRRCLTENTKILEELIQLRHKMARLLGYSNYAEYALENQMAKTPFKVMEFLVDISENISNSAAKELQRLKDLKREEEGEAVFGMEDLQYYMHKAEELEFEIDYATVKQYFPVDSVTSGILKIYEQLFCLKFETVQAIEVWHPDVSLYSVFDSSCNQLLGFFYLDVYIRDGKFSHACVIPLQDGCLMQNGTRQLPVATLIANFTKPTADNPAVLRFAEVVTYFQHFGHVVHHICSHVSLAKFSGIRVETDFVELSSQLLENLCHESVILKMMSGFYKDIHKPVPDEVCRALKKKRKSFSGLKTKQKIVLCLFDQIIHTNEVVDTKALLRDLYPKEMLHIPLLEGTNPAASLMHLATGYDARCYNFIWSEVFAADMFLSKFKDDCLNWSVGIQYKNKVLAPGGSKDALDILHEFLERELSQEGYMKENGFLTIIE